MDVDDSSAGSSGEVLGMHFQLMRKYRIDVSLILFSGFGTRRVNDPHASSSEASVSSSSGDIYFYTKAIQLRFGN